MKAAPAVHHTMGGIEINPNAQVTKADGSVIPGLYAAGEVPAASTAKTAWAAWPSPTSRCLAAWPAKTRRPMHLASNN